MKELNVAGAKQEHSFKSHLQECVFCSELLERRNELVNLAGKAPMGPPWFAFIVEYRCNEHQRIAHLVRAVDERSESITDLNLWHRRFVATSIFDSVRVAGRIEYNPNAFEILLDEDDEFASSQYDPWLSGSNLDVAKQGAELVRTCIQLLNWDRGDVPTQTLVNPKQQKQKGGKKGSIARTKKSDPTIIKFEPFLKSTRAGTHRGSSGARGFAAVVASRPKAIKHAFRPTACTVRQFEDCANVVGTASIRRAIEMVAGTYGNAAIRCVAIIPVGVKSIEHGLCPFAI
jgi:hypothetical protein